MMFNLKFNTFKQTHHQKWTWHFYTPTYIVDKTIKSHGPQHTRKKLVNSDFEVQLSSEITKNSQETIHDAAIFIKLLLFMDNPF